MAKMDDETLLSVLDTLEQQAAQYVTGSLRAARDRNVKEYFQRPYGNEDDGWSQYVASDTADTIEWATPEILDIFLSTDKAVVFLPTRADEVDGAKQATEGCNHVFFEQNNGFMVLQTLVRDMLQVRTCAVHWRTKTVRTRQAVRFQNLTDIEIAVKARTLGLTSPDDFDLEITAEQAEPIMAPMETPLGIIPQPTGETRMRRSGRIRHVVEEKKVAVESFDPDSLLVQSDWTSPLLEDCPYVCRVMEVTLSDLKQMGFDDVLASDLSSSDEPVGMDSEDRRARTGEQFSVKTGRENAEGVDTDDESLTRGYLRIEWVLVDYDGDGIAERREIWRLEDTILSNEEADEVPVATGSPIMIQHRWDGLALADTTSDVQLVNTELMRGVLNNAYSANNPRKTVLTTNMGAPLADIGDVLDGRPGGLTRIKQPGAISYDVTPYVGHQMEPLLNRFEGLREQRSGVTKQRMGLDPNSLRTDRTLGETQMIDNAAAKRMKLMARMVAETVLVPVFRGILRLLTSGDFDKLFFELRGRFVEYDPNEWSNRYRMRANVGLGTGDNEKQQIGLRGILETQMKLAQSPLAAGEKKPRVGPDGKPMIGPDGQPMMIDGRKGMVTPKQIFNTLDRLSDLAGFKNVGEFFTDPGEGEMPAPPPPPPPVQVLVEQIKQKAAAEKLVADQKFEAFRLQLEADAEQRQQSNQNEVQAANDERDAARAEVEAMRKTQIEAGNVALERYKVDRDNWTKISIAKMQNPDAELPPGYALDPATGTVIGPDPLGAMMEALRAIFEQQNSPTSIVYDEVTRKPVAVVKGGIPRPVQYGPDGRIIGHQ